uniref:Uncharacterized protein n=1 Tax=Anguilla anguilla TaxID=7936 RepID=A0A0E9VH97_ANGAN
MRWPGPLSLLPGPHAGRGRSTSQSIFRLR